MQVVSSIIKIGEVHFMPLEIDGQTYYRTSEVCKKTGISRATLFRWLRQGIIKQLHKDRRGWRLFTEDDLIRIRSEATKIEVQHFTRKGKRLNTDKTIE